MSHRVVVVSNDLVPGQGAAVAAPGVRAHGLATGLAAHGFEVDLLVDAAAVARYEERTGATVAGGHVVAGPDLMDRLTADGPATVVLINGNQATHVEAHADLRYVVDVFAARHLEVAHLDDEGKTASRLTDDLVSVLSLASGIIANGTKKAAYALAWLLQTDRDPRTVPIEVVGPAIGPSFTDAASPPRLLMAGYQQRWGGFDAAAEALLPLAADGVTIDVVLGSHWGTDHDTEPSPVLADLLASESVTGYEPMPYDDLLALTTGATAFLDIAPWSWERAMSTPTRSVVALSCGVPVVHPPFTELSPSIEDHDAGWLVDPADGDAVRDAVAEALGDEAVASAKAEGARRLVIERFDPKIATTPLAGLVSA